MKDIITKINEASKPIKSAKFENIPGSVLYKELINAIRKDFEKNIKDGCSYLIDLYDKILKDINSNNLNDKGIFAIAIWGRVSFKDNPEPRKWINNQFVLPSESLDRLYNTFEKYWDEPVITGERKSTKSRVGSMHILEFKFPDDTKISTNASFGSVRNLLKYAVEKEY